MIKNTLFIHWQPRFKEKAERSEMRVDKVFMVAKIGCNRRDNWLSGFAGGLKG
ncbi:hypothetical protein [Erwinia pyrifoliae]|uniref:Uncharacterized protein n=1 Tax=Erwinia pyrifoliae TaxID=79967 RepID=A0ABY5X6Z7_ERWPY|nr:hypothetical protein [Erwinia pyrifoliae]MCT2385990.1 hypothetical protein [Erwinia pyrifoliae]MCU8588424.1 hypothetical protein [Erwinia pyrifoliae]UWS33142.1 hypothetical protein NYP84_16340 [Erwinia pyrifoliae]